MTDDPLEALLLDADEVDRARLASALAGVLGLDTKTGRVVLKPGFAHLDVRRKILAFLLGQKVAVLLGKADNEQVAPKDLIGSTGMPSGSVHPALKDLREKRVVSVTNSGAYYVAAHQVDVCLALVEGGG